MTNIHAHELHQMVRSWLLAEDPYGMNQRTEPTFNDPAGYPKGWGDTQGNQIGSARSTVPASQNPGAGGTVTSDRLRASTEGEAAVANALTPASGADALRAQNYGRGAVDRELQKPPTPNVNSEAFQGERNPRAQGWGESAVGRATGPSPTAEVDRTRAQGWGEAAVDKALNPPMGSGGGFWMPAEAADTAGAVGEQAVEGALAKKARSKVARGRLKDPQDPDDRQSE
jgi:hypothetical protein